MSVSSVYKKFVLHLSSRTSATNRYRESLDRLESLDNKFNEIRNEIKSMELTLNNISRRIPDHGFYIKQQYRWGYW